MNTKIKKSFIFEKKYIYGVYSVKAIIFCKKSNQTFHYTRWITPKRVTNWRGPSPRHCARATQLLSEKYRSDGEPLATLSDLTGPRFEPLTSRSRDERVTAQPTGRFHKSKIAVGA